MSPMIHCILPSWSLARSGRKKREREEKRLAVASSEPGAAVQFTNGVSASGRLTSSSRGLANRDQSLYGMLLSLPIPAGFRRSHMKAGTQNYC